MEDIKVKLARIDEKFEALVNEGRYTWESLEEGLLMARQSTVVEHLEEMHAAGMPCPSLEEVVSWIGVYLPPEIEQFARTLEGMSDEQARVILGVAECAMDIADKDGEEAAIAFLNDLHADVEQIAAQDMTISPEKLNALLREAAEADAEASGTACDSRMYEGIIKTDKPEEYMTSAGGIPVHDYGNDRNVYRVEVGKEEIINQETLDKLVSQFEAKEKSRCDEIIAVPPVTADDLIRYVQENFAGAEITRKYGTMGQFGIAHNGSLTIVVPL